MVSGNISNTLFVYQHRETSEIRVLYIDDAHAMTKRDEWLHVGSLEPRAWIEAHWRVVTAWPEVLTAFIECCELIEGEGFDPPGNARNAIAKATEGNAA